MLIKLIIGLGLALYITGSQAESPNANMALLQYQQAMNLLLGRNGSEKSPQKAAVIFKALAEQNWKSAQHMLGNLYYKGLGIEKNDLLAYKWLSIASRDNLHLAEAVYKKRKALQSRLSGMRLQQVEQWIDNWQPRHRPTASHNNL